MNAAEPSRYCASAESPSRTRVSTSRWPSCTLPLRTRAMPSMYVTARSSGRAAASGRSSASTAAGSPSCSRQSARSRVARMSSGCCACRASQLLRRARQVGRLVVREREVVADAAVGRRDRERAAIGLDRLLVAAERRERRAEVRPRLGRGPEAQALAVRRDRALEVAGLVQGDGAGERGARVLGRRGGGDDRHAQRAPPRGARGRTRALRALPTGSCPDAGCARRTTGRW